MMGNFAFGGFGLGMYVHMLFATLLFLAFLLIFVYAWKHLSKNDLRNWIIGLLIVGILGVLLSAQMGWGMMSWNDDENSDRWDFMQKMMGLDEEDSGETESVE